MPSSMSSSTALTTTARLSTTAWSSLLRAWPHLKNSTRVATRIWYPASWRPSTGGAKHEDCRRSTRSWCTSLGHEGASRELATSGSTSCPTPSATALHLNRAYQPCSSGNASSATVPVGGRAIAAGRLEAPHRSPEAATTGSSPAPLAGTLGTAPALASRSWRSSTASALRRRRSLRSPVPVAAAQCR